MVNTADRKVNLGALRVGKSVHRSVKIINNSLAHISFSTAITPSMPALQQTNILSISPTTEISLKPKATCNIDVYFTPKTRIPQFSEEVINVQFYLFLLLTNLFIFTLWVMESILLNYPSKFQN